MAFDDSGPAFPALEKVQEYRDDRYRDVYMPMGGMTLRDYFAGQMMIAGMSSPSWVKGLDAQADTERMTLREALAQMCYQYADAMLEERKGKS